MKMSITLNQLNSLNHGEKVKLTCLHCNNPFLETKSRVRRALNPNHNTSADFCNKKCYSLHSRKKIETFCKECSNSVLRTPYQYGKSKNHFCNHSCRATYQNKNKTTGFRQSKAEIYLLSLISNDFPDLQFNTNDRTVIPSGLELDIYFSTVQIRN